ncbi:amino acid ABC transporter permease [Pollutimonas bauzanensis]|uniref:L-glutamate ABC transporter membrane protein/L-aspartate ABC transporter membrane protein n=1 Tax=Pollutimonas bauzanensis TaxID=658167 RepID=A0A1M5PY39_9BURK|nr:amino acid ABC transporter permease [Pollutimonas bauzanensis]SHH06917.1 L-glutamate ABC transporter membrane protein/L-aspartate ABC transporter membrane protein [Pollutimonas bauzanensis]
MNYDWSWQVFWEMSPDGVHTFLQTIFIGAGWTLTLSLCTWVFALFFGSILAVFRTAKSRPLNVLGTVYVEIFRNIPLLVQMFLWYFVLPELLPVHLGTAIKQMAQPWGQFIPAVLCLSFYGSARMAEQVRAGIQSLPRGQFQAATALGLTQVQAYRYIILPEALRIVIAPLTSEFMAAIKYSSLALTIGLLELTGQARAMQESSFHIFEAFSAATVVYLLINSIVVLGMHAMERRVAIPGLIGSAVKRNQWRKEMTHE